MENLVVVAEGTISSDRVFEIRDDQKARISIGLLLSCVLRYS